MVLFKWDICSLNLGYYEQGEDSIKRAKYMDPENKEYKAILVNLIIFIEMIIIDRAYNYNRRRHSDLGGCCCCCCDDCCCCLGDDCCEDCMKLWCLDSML